MRGYKISVATDGRVAINGREIENAGTTEDALSKTLAKINSLLMDGSITEPMKVTLSDTRPDGIGSKESYASPGEAIPDSFLQVSEAAQAALVPHAPWGRIGGGTGNIVVQSSITRSAAAAAPESEKSDARKMVEARESKRRKIVLAVFAVGIVIVGARFALTTQWTPPTYAAICVDSRTTLRTDRAALCDSGSEFYAWRYIPQGSAVPAVGKTTTGSLKAIPASDASRAVIHKNL